MPVSNVWNDPSAGGVLDLTAGTIVTEAYTDALASNLLYLAGSTGVITQVVSATAATVESTTSNSGIVMSAPAAAITTVGGTVIVLAGVTLSNSTTATTNSVYIAQDNVVGNPLAIFTENAVNGLVPVVVAAKFNPSAATHTYQTGWAASGGTLSTNASQSRWIIIVELRR